MGGSPVELEGRGGSLLPLGGPGRSTASDDLSAVQGWDTLTVVALGTAGKLPENRQSVSPLFSGEDIPGEACAWVGGV